ncbi:hypothetical protein BDR26DRAFT_860140 [Obelidium mucronatum]|nr:hypothetical protein BDR26DRAFT_860140 [Obelidium mucronatum]
MVEKHWEGCELLKVEQKEHERHCLGHMTHWQLSESLTLRIILMLSNDPNIDLMGTGAKPLHWAIANNHTIIVKTLLHLYPNVDLSRDSNRLLAKAAASGHSEVVKLILSDPRVDPAIGDTRFMPLALAAHFGKVNSDREDSYVKVVKILLADSRVDPTFPDNMAVQCAARGSSIEKMLLADARVRLLGVPRGNGLFEKLGGWVFSTITQFLP